MILIIIECKYNIINIQDISLNIYFTIVLIAMQLRTLFQLPIDIRYALNKHVTTI